MRSPVACAVMALACPTLGWAQGVQAGSPSSAPLQLKPSVLLQEQFSDDIKRDQPTFLFGDRLSGRPDLDIVVQGNAELRRTGTVIRADRIEYYQPDDLAKIRGNVRLHRFGNNYQGSELQLKVDAMEGYFLNATYQLRKNGIHGEAERIDFVDDKRAVARNASYTSCTRVPGPDWLPDWVLKATQIRLDYDSEVGVADGVQVNFKGVPILAWPSMSFPLTDARKSGWLPPVMNLDNTSGLELMVPYYWNIAPNRDATLFPSLMTKRGINLGGEFRYLEKDYKGTTRLDWMPNDKLRGISRWGVSATHSGSVTNPFASYGPLGLNLNLNRVGDHNYWSDFPRATSSLTQRLLANDAALSWKQDNVELSLRSLKWQTLQNTTSVITPPYDKLPQLNARYSRSQFFGLDLALEADHTRFIAAQSLSLQPNAQRQYAIAQISRPWVTPGAYLVPKLQMHWTGYQFSSPIATGAVSATRLVPSASVDSGLILERSASYFGRNFTQTLEPRAFYVYTPFRNQAALPNYDSGIKDFNFATLYSENAFVGNDRISDENLLTLGMTSRLIDPTTGAEALRLGFAQRLRFKDRNVTLAGGVPDTARVSDMLFGATLNWDPRWASESTVQYNPKLGRSERATFSTRYSPGSYRTVSAGYRFSRNASSQLDVGWQWPIADLWGDKGKDLGAGQGQGAGRWYAVGRLNYSLRDSKIVDTVTGFEYDAGCWLGRVVVERLQTTTATANKRILLQLELVGFSRLGTNALKTLRDSVPRYQYLRETTQTPSRFSQYE